MTLDQFNKDILEFINYSKVFAEQLLVEAGEFFPFASQIDNYGVLSSVIFDDDNDDNRAYDSISLLDTMTSYFEKELSQNKIRSYCLTYDVRVKNDLFPNGTDAVIISIKQADKLLKCYYPYSIQQENNISYHKSWSEESASSL